MSKLKIKQIYSNGAPANSVISTDGNGNTIWTTVDGSSTTLGAPTDGSLTGSRYDGGKPPAATLQETDRVVDAIDQMNEILGLLLPDAPTAFGGATLALSTSTTSALFAQDATINHSGTVNAGSSVARVSAANVSTVSIGDRGNGMAGTISLYLNDSVVSGETLNFSESIGDSKSSGSLRISDNKWTVPAGFFQTFDTVVNSLPVSVGANTVQIKHTISGDTNILSFVRDDMLSLPVVTGVSVTQGTLNSSYSSGIPHYGAASTLTVSSTVSNLSGQTYSSGTVVSISGPGTNVSIAPGSAGLPSILPAYLSPTTLTAQTFTVSGNRHQVATIGVTATNPNGNGSGTSATNVLVKSGTPNGAIDENSISSNLGVAVTRVSSPTGGDYPTLAYSLWDSTQSKQNYEASVVGGVLKQDITDYTTGYLPIGPDYSTKDGTQYITLKFSKAGLSTFTISVTGTYSDLLIGLPGISDNNTLSPNALGGAWWSAKSLYNGSGIPGRTGDTTAGCANATIATGSGTQTVSINLGAANTSSSTGNTVLVRIKLTSGQAITALAINS